MRYHDVVADKDARRRFLELSGGDRRVPLVVTDGVVQVGHGGT